MPAMGRICRWDDSNKKRRHNFCGENIWKAVTRKTKTKTGEHHENLSQREILCGFSN